MELLNAILRLERIDTIQRGQGDYLMSVVKLGAWPTSEKQEVERELIEACRKSNIPTRAEIGAVDEANHYLDLGIRHFQIGMAIRILYDWLKTNAEALCKTIKAG